MLPSLLTCHIALLSTKVKSRIRLSLSRIQHYCCIMLFFQNMSLKHIFAFVHNKILHKKLTCLPWLMLKTLSYNKSRYPTSTYLMFQRTLQERFKLGLNHACMLVSIQTTTYVMLKILQQIFTLIYRLPLNQFLKLSYIELF